MPRFHHVLLPALALLFLVIYNIGLADIYAYEGMVPVIMDIDFWIIFIVTMFFIYLVFPTRIERPSDMFLFFYPLISVLWGTVFWGGTGLIEAADQPLFFALIILPVFIVLGTRYAVARFANGLIFPVVLASSAWLPYILALLLLISGFLAASTIGGGSFDWQEMYVRRLAGRTAYEGQVFAAYATSMGTNGILPILGFAAGYRRSPILMGLAFMFVIMMFFLLGLKSPAINLVALSGLGFCFSFPGLRKNLVPLTLFAILVVYMAALLAIFQSENLFLADYIVRRISMVQPQVQSYYFDHWMNGEAKAALIAAAGMQFSDLTFEIGYLYLNNPQTNANTNAFIYALARGGIISYVISMFGVAVILSAIDAFADKNPVAEYYALAALLSILVSEQAWTTVLLTSGIALCLVLVVLFSYPSRAGTPLAK